MTLPTDSKERKDTPIARGVLDYFPAALAAVARLSKAGNDKHNPGEEMHHARGKSTDHADCIVRHLMDRGTVDEEDGIRHSVKVAWRALALLQEELEAAGEATLARGARLPYEGPSAPNNIDQRIAGDSEIAKRIKNRYYRGLEVGGVYDEKRPNDLGVRFVSCLLLGWNLDTGNAIVEPYKLGYPKELPPDNLVPAAVDVWDEDEKEVSFDRHASV